VRFTFFVSPIIHYLYSFWNFRNLAIDGGHELCGEMYNKNVLAPLKAFIPKARNWLVLAVSHSDFTSKDSPNPITISGKPKICARERPEDRVRVGRQCYYHVLVFIVSYCLTGVRPPG